MATDECMSAERPYGMATFVKMLFKTIHLG